MFAAHVSEPRLARDIMVRRVVTVRPEADVAEGIHLLLKYGVSGMPVVDAENRYLGVFSEKCCMRVLTQTVQLIEEPLRKPVRVPEFMVRRLFVLSPDDDACAGISRLLKHRVSGAPVTQPDGTFLGVFSEKTSMSVLIQAAYDETPSGKVRSYMNTELGRVISEDADLFECARLFVETPYRRLVVLRDGKVMGQISRRDVLSNSQILERIIRCHLATAGQQSPGQENKPGEESALYLQAHRQLPSTDVLSFMDTGAQTIGEDLDLLAIAQIFLQTPYRRLPVLREGQVVGQVSRRDVLNAFCQLTDPPSITDEGATLYLSAIHDRSEVPIS